MFKKLICFLFGCRPNSGYADGREYFNVVIGATDGIGRVHASLWSECGRCGEKRHVGNIHVPDKHKLKGYAA